MLLVFQEILHQVSMAFFTPCAMFTWVSHAPFPHNPLDLKHIVKKPTADVSFCCLILLIQHCLINSILTLSTPLPTCSSAEPKSLGKKGARTVRSSAIQHNARVEMLSMHTIQYGSHQPYKAIECLKCGQGD